MSGEHRKRWVHTYLETQPDKEQVTPEAVGQLYRDATRGCLVWVYIEVDVLLVQYAIENIR